jgi:hypothetical protein
MNCTANQMTLGVLGPVAYGLGLTDAIVYANIPQSHDPR